MTRLPEQGKRTLSASVPPAFGEQEHTTSIRTLSEPVGQRSASGPDLALDEPSVEASGPPSGRRVTQYVPGVIVADKYQLRRPLGSGGMGEIWVAHHLGLDIDVAVKFIGSASATEPGLAERLLEEARNTARLGHPAIVRALDFGHTVQRDPFIVLELLAGEDLATRIELQGPLDPEQAVATLLPIAHALSVVHESGIVHRDIKPENVFLAQSELGLQAKLLDFGISHKTDRVRRLTLRDTALGTPDYMSPEQARGERSDARTDQWSFCIVLFEAITQNRPFTADNYNALLRTIIDDAPRSLASFGLDQPELWSILTRGLAKAANDRYPSMRELGEALACWLLERGVTEDSVGTSLRRAWLNEVSSVVSVKDLLSPGELVPEVRALERASTQALPASAAAEPPLSVRVRTPRADVHAPVMVALEEALKPSGGHHSVPDLEALAELHRGGDPELRLRRDAQRRVIVTLAVIVLITFGGALSILVGTGMIAL
ncbi:MAG TPA: serine/threonine-protein kinase [Polyangiaceae bacterium]|nr:serine/threonine-protein kinase [Polyangiaceae bacterium]